MPITTTSAPIAVIIGGVLTYVANIRMTNPTPQGGDQPFQNPQVGTADQWPPAGNILPPQALPPIHPYPSNNYT
jgi:hypothetical protein